MKTSLRKKCLVGFIGLCAAAAVHADDIDADHLFAMMADNVRAQNGVEIIVEIDHARLASAAGSTMPPSRVLIWSDPQLEASLLALNPLVAVDLPLRALAYQNKADGPAMVTANRYDYIRDRYDLPDDAIMREHYERAIDAAWSGIPQDRISTFVSDQMEDAGLVILESPFDFATTEERLLTAIQAQSDTVMFGDVDFQARSRSVGVNLHPVKLILFGGPEPGGRAMKAAPTLGLDAFCQKLVIWEDAQGKVRVAFNDLLALAKRQGVTRSIPLRFINRRLKSTFSDALKP